MNYTLFLQSALSTRLSSAALTLLSITAGSLLTATQQVLAQTPAPVASTSTNLSTLPPVEIRANSLFEGLQLSESTQTGSRLDIPLGQLPASVSVIDQALIQQRNEKTVIEAVQNATGVLGVNRAGAPGVFSMRGFTENAVGTLFNGIRVQGSTVTTRTYDPFLFERIEVLRGPASSLFGEGSLAGAVNYVRKSAQRLDQPLIDVIATVGTNNTRRIGAGLNAKAGEGVYYRFDAVSNQYDTDIKGNRHDYQQAVGSVLWDINSRLNMRFEVDVLRNRVEDSYWGIPFVQGKLDERLAKVNYNNLPNNRYADNVNWLRWQTEWQPRDGFRLTNQMYRYDATRDWQNTYRTQSLNDSQVARRVWEDLAYDHLFYGNRTELAVDGDWGGKKQQIVVGAEINRTDFNSPLSFQVRGAGVTTVDALNPAPADFYAPNRGTVRMPNRQTQLAQHAIFAEHRIQLTSATTLLSSVRQDWINADFGRNVSANNASYFSAEYRPVSWRIAPSYQVNPTTNVYVAYGTSSTPNDSLLVMGATNAGYPLSEAKGLELGIKQHIPQYRLDWTAAVYDLTRTNIPSAASDPTFTAIAGQQSSRGAEVSVAIQPTSRLNLSANAAYTDAQFDTTTFASSEFVTIQAGKTPTNVPRWIANAGVNYQFAPKWTSAAWVRHVSSRYADLANTLVMPEYTTLDLNVAYQLDRRQRLSIYVRNATDKTYATWSTFNGGVANASFADGRTMGVTYQGQF